MTSKNVTELPSSNDNTQMTKRRESNAHTKGNQESVAVNQQRQKVEHAIESRRENAGGSLPSQRNFKQNQILKKVIEQSRLAQHNAGSKQVSTSQPRPEIIDPIPSKSGAQMQYLQPTVNGNTRAADLKQLSASTAKHTSKAVKLSDSATTSIGKFTDKDMLQSSIKRNAETPARVKIIRFHKNLEQGGLFEQ